MRNFIIALMVGVTSLAADQRWVKAKYPAQGGSGNLLTAADFTLLTALRVPTGGTAIDTAGATGSIGGRVVGGEMHLFMWGTEGGTDPPSVQEVNATTCVGDTPCLSSATLTIGSAPRMKHVTTWGDISNGKRQSWFENGDEEDLTGHNAHQAALLWDESQGILFSSYLVGYTGQNAYTLIGTTLDNPTGPVTTTYGPWRLNAVDQDASFTWKGGRSHYLSKHPTTGKLLTGGSSKSGNAAIPWGPSMFAFNFPTTSSPGGEDSTAFTSLGEYWNFYTVGTTYGDTPAPNTGAATGTIKQFQYTANPALTYPAELDWGNSMTVTKVTPSTNGGVGTWSDEESGINGFVWIDGTNKDGVLFIGTIAACTGTSTDCADRATTSHEFYRSVGQNHDQCSHGCDLYLPVTGPGSTCKTPVFIIADPAKLDEIYANTRTDYTYHGEEIIDLTAGYGMTTAPMGELQARNVAGAVYWADQHLLYVNTNMADVAGGYQTVVWVFSVNDTAPIPPPARLVAAAQSLEQKHLLAGIDGWPLIALFGSVLALGPLARRRA